MPPIDDSMPNNTGASSPGTGTGAGAGTGAGTGAGAGASAGANGSGSSAGGGGGVQGQGQGASQQVPVNNAPPAWAQQLIRSQQALQREIADLRTRGTSPAGSGAGSGARGTGAGSDSEDPDAQLAEFSENPKSFILKHGAEAARGLINQYIAPVLLRGAEVGQRAELARHETMLDNQYGSGFFKDQLYPLLFTGDPDNPGAIERLSPAVKGDPDAVSAVVAAMLGQLMLKDPGGMTKRFNEAQAQQERTAQEAPNLMMPSVGYNPNRPDVVPAEVKEQVARARERGVDISIEDWQLSKQSDGTLEGYKAAQAAMRNSKGQGKSQGQQGTASAA